jgi:anti-anti-sigma regulatory factor
VFRIPDSFVHDGAAADQVWYTIDDRGAWVVLTVGGRVDSENCPGVCDAAQVAGDFSSGLVVDLTRTEFAQAEAAGLVVRSLQGAYESGSSVCVVGPPEPVGWLLQVNAHAADIPVCADLDEAAGFLAAASPTTSSPVPTTPSTGVL